MKKLLTIILVFSALITFSQGTNMYKMKRLKTDTLYLLKADSSISSVWALVWDSTTNKIGTRRLATDTTYIAYTNLGLTPQGGYTMGGGDVSVTDADDLDLEATNFTIEIVSNGTYCSGSEQFYIDKGDSGFYFSCSGAASYQFGKKGAAWGTVAGMSSYSGVTHHMVFIYDGSRAYVYRNGVKIKDQAQTTNLIKATTDVWRIGKDMGQAMFRVRIYASALTAAQVKQIFNNGNYSEAVYVAAPVLDLRPENATASTWYDATSHNHNGAVTTATLRPTSPVISNKILTAETDTAGVGATSKIGTMMYFNGHFYGLKAGTPPTWVQIDN